MTLSALWWNHIQSGVQKSKHFGASDRAPADDQPEAQGPFWAVGHVGFCFHHVSRVSLPLSVSVNT